MAHVRLHRLTARGSACFSKGAEPESCRTLRPCRPAGRSACIRRSRDSIERGDAVAFRNNVGEVEMEILDDSARCLSSDRRVVRDAVFVAPGAGDLSVALVAESVPCFGEA